MKATVSPSKKRLASYGSAALGTTALLAGQSDAATVVNVNASTYTTTLSGVGTISAARVANGVGFNGSVFFSSAVFSSKNFSRASSTTAPVNTGSSATSILYGQSNYGSNIPFNGAVLNSSDNWLYATASSDSSQRVWLQFAFGQPSIGGFSIVKAVYPSTLGELATPAAAAAVPEPSALALLSLGASGLLVRRRKAA